MLLGIGIICFVVGCAALSVSGLHAGAKPCKDCGHEPRFFTNNGEYLMCACGHRTTMTPSECRLDLERRWNREHGK